MSDHKLVAQAIEEEDLPCVQDLIRRGLDLNIPFADGRLPLAAAVTSGNLALAKIVLEAGADSNGVSGPNGDTPLTVASYRGLDGMANLLIRAGANVNKENGLKLSPLCIAASRDSRSHYNIVRVLLTAGADVNSGSGATPLMCSCYGLPETTCLLLEAGADVNAIRSRGTALHIAVEENKPAIMAIILQHGANLRIQTPSTSQHPGLTPLELAKKLNRRKMIPILQSTQTGECSAPERPPSSPRFVSWVAVADLIQKAQPSIAASFRKGATPAKIKNLERTIGRSLPEEFLTCLRVNNGQRQNAAPLVPPKDWLDSGYRLLSIDEILLDWKNLKQLRESAEFETAIVTSDKGVSRDWWNPGWVPFAGNDQGDYLCLDLAPAPSGTSGQIISMSHESGRRELLAPSFNVWLADLLTDLHQLDE
jgi:cell wall assembly regulator SMI1/ankyrin repeat protein